MSDVTPKSSASQLWKALEASRKETARWRRLAQAPDASHGVAPDEVVVPKVDVDELVATVASERARARAALEELADAREREAASGVAGDKPAGKPALADLRRIYDGFAAGVVNLPGKRRTSGIEAVRLAVASRLVPDLYLLGLTAPRSESEARDRESVRRMLDHPAFVAALSRDDPEFDRLRVVFLTFVARSFLRSSFYAVYERGAEQGSLDALGTVYK